ncbi:chromosome transmission fidelity protein 18 homolog [Oncorhynchus nerka]|uniref:chromosome transmission fidelity protein 18 homolog n=1 Tax=Oncorhynchus nerka TaxID=8023 RepID=UPI0031B873D6
MDQERMRRAESLMLLRNPKQEDEKEKQPKAVTSSVTSSVRNHQQRLENILRNTVVEIRPEVDFFGRAVAPKEKPQVVSATGEVCVEVAMGTAVGNSDVWFRFNEACPTPCDATSTSENCYNTHTHTVHTHTHKHLHQRTAITHTPAKRTHTPGLALTALGSGWVIHTPARSTSPACQENTHPC